MIARRSLAPWKVWFRGKMRERGGRTDGEGMQPLWAWLTTYQPVQKEGRKEREEKAQVNCGTTVKRRKREQTDGRASRPSPPDERSR